MNVKIFSCKYGDGRCDNNNEKIYVLIRDKYNINELYDNKAFDGYYNFCYKRNIILNKQNFYIGLNTSDAIDHLNKYGFYFVSVIGKNICKVNEESKPMIDYSNIIKRLDELENKIDDIFRSVRYIEDYCEDRP